MLYEVITPQVIVQPLLLKMAQDKGVDLWQVKRGDDQRNDDHHNEVLLQRGIDEAVGCGQGEDGEGELAQLRQRKSYNFV